MTTELEQYKKLRKGFTSYKFGFASPKFKRLVSLERKLKKKGILDVNGLIKK